ncbi:P-loop containing nucleoside triphosphate hydrolase protein [Podospora appendiculata]|uniref:P-loop containing nucleoside triphosphate hydrolase protein n=1 Tax=Podospora appendiculata TaxID=314037 RepID=A0AAE1CC23_9PEZI|nr:P-loop containing nucleoside triphosphate hydrolase protein [Podospora appendiculata]
MGDEECDAIRPQYMGPLFSMKLYRLVLDEGHAIKNYKSQSQSRLTMGTKFCGFALIELAKAHVLKPVWANLSKEETLLYRKVEEKVRKRLAAELRDGGISYAAVNWLMLALRLRQAVSHPFLLESMMRKSFSLDDIQWLMKQLTKMQTKTPLWHQIGRWCEEELQIRSVDEFESEHLGETDLNAALNILPQLELMARNKTMEGKLCGRCNLPLEDPFVPECGHAYCRDYIEAHVERQTEVGKEGYLCPLCKKPMANLKAFVRTSRDSMSPGPTISGGRTKSRSKGHKARFASAKPRQRGDDLNSIQAFSRGKVKSSSLADSDRDILNAPNPSTKMTVLINLILEWRRKHPGDKIIVFTQFILNGRVFGRVLQDEKVGFLYFFGSMSHTEKRKTIEDFAARDDAHVLIASLQCTALALNLTCANRVISLDLWWNYALEQQAFGRVYHMGQTKETYFARIMAKNTIDERMANLQLEKLRVIGQTIKDQDSSKIPLTKEEIIGLFGRAVRNEEGMIVGIESDYADEDEDDEARASDGEPIAGSGDTGSSDGSD